MPRSAPNFSIVFAYTIAGLGALPGLAYAAVYLQRFCWQIAHDWAIRFGFSSSGIKGGNYDFTAFWAAGTALRKHITINLYDPSQFNGWGRMLLHSPLLPFLYPPTTLPLFVALSWLPLPAAYDLFNLASLIVSLFLLWRCNIPLWCIAVGTIAPPVIFNIYLGQFGLLCGVLLIFGLCRVDRQPWLGGLALSLLALKPQYALLAPIAVLARRNWKAAIAGFLGAVIITASSFLILRGATWVEFFHQGHQALLNIITVPFDYASGQDICAYNGTSVFWMFRSLHIGITASYAGQDVISLLAIIAAWHVWRNDRLPHLNRLLLMVLLAMFVTPYGYMDDLCAISILLPTLARRYTPWRNAALACLWSAPAFIHYITQRLHFLITPLLLASILALTWYCRLESATQKARGTMLPDPA